MTTKLYPHTHYIWHRILLRVVVLGPIKITGFVSDCISGACQGLDEVFNEILPVSYRQTMVEFDQLTKGEQEEIERIAKARDTTKERMLFQVNKV